MSDCLSNLDKCKASCCKVIVFEWKGYMPQTYADYYLKHGCKLKRVSRDSIKVIVPSVCRYLDQDTSLCTLHDTNDKPLLCRKLDHTTYKSGGFHITEGCIYGN